ncbi:MAG: methionine gamma-lyase family protein [Oscillospiraceae bacterium]|nr:methionine gamma-lyase family protein [Oscillospiraceae bacterium]
MSEFFEISNRIEELSDRALQRASEQIAKIDKITEYNQQKVLAAFIKNKVDETDFNTSTGYGYSDKGREKLDCLVADIFKTDSAIIRAGALASGTHTLAVCLYGILRPGDTMLCVSSTPYDTIHSVIGLGGKNMGDGTLADFGITYQQIDLTENDEFDFDAIENAAKSADVRMVYIQRSRGYELRHSISVDEIAKVCEIVHRVNKRAVVMVDNCYGVFTETKEPTEVGADLVAGSLIKNMGGGIAPSGGYVAGREDLVKLVSYRLTTPGLGTELGATLGQNRNIFMGIFNSPHIVGEALKTAVFAASLFDLLGFNVTPKLDETRHDIIEAICLKNEENLIAFCQGLQKGAPVDSYVVPEPWDMPGYDSKVIMSAGAFTGGSSIELSADAPLREPFAVWMQGSLNFHSGKLGVMLAAEEMYKRGLIG